MTEKELAGLVEQAGEVKSATVVIDRDTGREGCQRRSSRVEAQGIVADSSAFD
jgi:hypothetical protein